MNSNETAYSANDILENNAPYKLGECLAPTHVDAESAYQIADYPYGRLRTTMKIWIHTNKKGAQRIMRQTQNPKTGRWNKPKASTYSEIKVLHVDTENGHIESAGFSLAYGDAAKFLAKYETALNEDQRKTLTFKVEYTRLMDEAKAATPLAYGSAEYVSAHTASFKQALQISGRL